jgi:hypothetical protein
MDDRQIGPQTGELTRATDEELRSGSLDTLNLVVNRIDDPANEIRKITTAQPLVIVRFVEITARVDPLEDAFRFVYLAVHRLKAEGDDVLGDLTRLCDRDDEDGRDTEPNEVNSMDPVYFSLRTDHNCRKVCDVCDQA